MIPKSPHTYHGHSVFSMKPNVHATKRSWRCKLKTSLPPRAKVISTSYSEVMKRGRSTRPPAKKEVRSQESEETQRVTIGRCQVTGCSSSSLNFFPINICHPQTNNHSVHYPICTS